MIAAFSVEQDDLAQRRRVRCAECGKRRLATRCVLRNVGTGAALIRWFCNECLAATPGWRP